MQRAKQRGRHQCERGGKQNTERRGSKTRSKVCGGKIGRDWFSSFFPPFCPSGFRPRQKRDPLVRKPTVNAAWNSRGPRRQRRSHGEKTNIGSPPEFTVTHREPIWVRFGFLRVRILRSACAGPQRRMCGRDASLRVCVYSEQACCNVRSRS